MAPRFDRKVGDRITNWSLVEPLGAGGNAEVWRARGLDGGDAALKILRQTNPAAEPYQRFRAEISVLQRLGPFRGVLPLRDAYLPDRPSRRDPPWLAVPIAIPVRDALGPQAQLRPVVEAIQSIAHALARLETDHHIYHRDIKPENLYRYQEQWCLGDFGLVDYPEKVALTAPGRHIGPIYYLAPELLSNPDESASGPADVYALAKTLWVLATGQSYPLPGFLPRHVPQFRIGSYITDGRVHFLELLVEKATDPNPAHRPTMRAVANELSAWLEDPIPGVQHIDLSELRAQISPIVQQHVAVQEARDRLVNHIDTSMVSLMDKFRPIAESLEAATGLKVNLGHHATISNLPEIHQYFKQPGYLSYRAAGFFIESPGRIGVGNNTVQLHGGIAIHFTKSATLLISGAYGIHLGAGSYRTIWVHTFEAESETAQEAQAISTTLSELQAHLPQAVLAFVDELRTRTP